MAAWMIPCDLAEKRSFSFQIRFAAAVDFVCYDSSHLLVRHHYSLFLDITEGVVRD